MLGVLTHNAAKIAGSEDHGRLKVMPGEYFLVTMHRADTVHVQSRLQQLVDCFQSIACQYREPVVCGLNPRSGDRMKRLGMSFSNAAVRSLQPLGLFNLVALEKKAHCVLSDSGTVQEECAIFGVPSVALRDVTERPEMLEAGSNMLAGVRRDGVVRVAEVMLSAPPVWGPPARYRDTDLTAGVPKIVLPGLPA